MDGNQPLAGAIVTALVIAAAVWATIGSPLAHNKVGNQPQSIARR